MEVGDCLDETRAKLRDMMSEYFRYNLSNAVSYSPYIDNITVAAITNNNEESNWVPSSDLYQLRENGTLILPSAQCSSSMTNTHAFRVGIIFNTPYGCDLPPYIYSTVSNLLANFSK